jgi:hypothetical protein
MKIAAITLHTLKNPTNLPSEFTASKSGSFLCIVLNTHGRATDFDLDGVRREGLVGHVRREDRCQNL